jgi:hypothetical protein
MVSVAFISVSWTGEGGSSIFALAAIGRLR